MTNLDYAVEDIRQEVSDGKDFDSVLSEVASDYALNPALVRRAFGAKYPNGVPTIVNPTAIVQAMVADAVDSACIAFGVEKPFGTYIVNGERYAVICRDPRATVWCHAVRLSDGARFKLRMSAMKKAA